MAGRSDPCGGAESITKKRHSARFTDFAKNKTEEAVVKTSEERWKMIAVRHENLFVENAMKQCDCDSNCGDDCKCKPNDNSDELFSKFDLILNPRYVGGYQWFCKNCGKPVRSTELWFPCQNRFVTISVLCHFGCWNRWSLEMNPVAPKQTH